MSTITIDYIFQRATDVLNQAILVLLGVAIVVFMWGIIQYVLASGDEKKLAAGRSYMLYGIVGLTVMVAVWGFVNLLVYTIFGGAAGDPFSFTIPSI